MNRRNRGAPPPLRSWLWRYLSASLVLATLALTPTRVLALPAFAAQTGQPCQMCHVAGLGPQLTPYGRSFKIHG